MNHLELLSEVSLILGSSKPIDDQINKTLATIGLHTGVSRVYIFEDSVDGLTTTNTFEWCNVNIESQIEELSNIPYSTIPSWKNNLDKNRHFYYYDVSQSPEEVRNILEPQGIQSILIDALTIDNKVFGFIGYDECHANQEWTSDEKYLLKVISKLISSRFEREVLENEKRKITEVANRDQLTNAFSRHHLFEKLVVLYEEAIRHQKKITIAMIDIDFFKKINDTHGHLTGDFVLKEFARIIMDNIRTYDFLARYGGEEFLIVIPYTDLENAFALVNRILELVREKRFKFNNEYHQITFSCGIAHSDEVINENIKAELFSQKLIDLADSRLYLAKKTGRNQICTNG